MMAPEILRYLFLLLLMLRDSQNFLGIKNPTYLELTIAGKMKINESDALHQKGALVIKVC